MVDKFYSREIELTYDDVLIVPMKTSVRSRTDVNLNVNIGTSHLKYPIMSAAMDTVTGKKMVEAMADAGGLAIVHRFQSVSDRLKCVSASMPAGIAVGLDETEEEILELASHCEVIALDIAHAHATYCITRTKELSEILSSTTCQLMVGNIVTRQAAWELIEAGADILKVGIGGGSACSTRIVTGMGYPNVSAILEVRKAIDEHKFGRTIKLVADGGIRTSGDIAKALASGADCVMVGGMLAGCDESPGLKKMGTHGVYTKEFRGMASKEAQDDWKGGLKSFTVAEGVASYVDATGPAKDTIENLMGGLRSSFTYADANNIKEFQQNTQFVRVTTNCLNESKPRV